MCVFFLFDSFLLDLLFIEIKSSEEQIFEVNFATVFFLQQLHFWKWYLFHSSHLYNHHAWHIKFIILSVLGRIVFLCPLDSNQANVCFWPIKTVMAAISASILIQVIFLDV